LTLAFFPHRYTVLRKRLGRGQVDQGQEAFLALRLIMWNTSSLDMAFASSGRPGYAAE
jgi:hypothetical protein